MNLKNTFLALFTAISPIFLLAQDLKNTYSIGGSAQMNYLITGSGNGTQFSLNPSFGTMLNSHWQVSGSAYAFRDALQTQSYVSNESQIMGKVGGVSLKAQYFFNPQSTFKYYAAVGAAGYFGDGSQSNNLNSNALFAQFGVVKMINPEVAIDAYLGLNMFKFENSATLNISLRNFITWNSNKTKQTPQYLAAKRQTLDGSFMFEPLNYFSTMLEARYSYFLNRHFSVGGEILGFSYINSYITSSYAISPQIRAYLPITSGLFAYGQLSSRILKRQSLPIQIGGGINYFITPNIAVDVNVSSFSFVPHYSEFSIGPKAKIITFIR
jgi:hypothetical protein